ncbi:hypothetical protein [Thiofilum flexile]|uniref:hypothetical protein n=1 Tax=Thiofilum flexile TaxID=125627 RepID=UPI0003773654|nr:hypothetical protein [Thiofilum flexile]
MGIENYKGLTIEEGQILDIKALQMALSKHTYMTIETRPIQDMDAYKRFLGKDNEDIERELLGAPAIDCLKVSKDMGTAIPVGHPDLIDTKPLRKILRKFKGIYSF